MHNVTIKLPRVTESLAQVLRDLPDMRHLFHRRTNERGQTFPFWLTNDSQAAAKFCSCAHHRIARKGRTDFGQRMVEREIISDNSGERTRLACWLRCLAATDF